MKSILLLTLTAGILVACSNEPRDAQSSGGGGSSAIFGNAAIADSGTAGGSTGSSAAGSSAGVAGSEATGGIGFDGTAARGSVVDASEDESTDQGESVDSGSDLGTGGSSGIDGSTVPDAERGDSAPLIDAGADVLNIGDSGSDAGDAGTYQPCPTNGDPCKILPLGDSITWGWGDEDNGGYRGPLFALVVAAHQNITFTGSLENGPSLVSGQAFPKKNEGHNGWTISTVNSWSDGKSGIASLIPSPAFDSESGGMPHIILMMIGTNDTDDSTATEMVDRLATLMDKIINAAPEALLVVAKITPKSWTATVVDAYNDAIPGLVQARAGDGKHIVLADMNTGFTAAMMSSDDLHPNSAGYKFMAENWYSVIGSLLPE